MNTPVIDARVVQIVPLTDTITQLILMSEHYVPYDAGQYLQMHFATEAFCYSIANAPLGAHHYELHIRHSLENPYNRHLLTHIQDQGQVSISLPYGECSIQHLDPGRPILFIAAGTGFAPVKAMIEHLLANEDQRPFELFWGARSRNDLYLDEQVRRWQNHVSRFTYCSSLSEENPKSLASQVIDRHAIDLHQWQIIISGPFDMVYSTRDILIQQGMSPKHLFSDAFCFEVIK